MNPQKHLHDAILDALKEFPGLDQITIKTAYYLNPPAIAFSIVHNGRAATRIIPISDYAHWEREALRDNFIHRIGEMVESVKGQGPGPGAAWGERKVF